MKIGSKVPISLEIAPPETTNWIDRIVSTGVNGFSINIEVWNEEKRREICPGKSQIDRELYFTAWKRGVDLLGKFTVSSVLIVGLDSPESIKEAIVTMVGMGVKPTLIPFKPFSGSKLENHPLPHPQELLELSQFAGQQLSQNAAQYQQFVGCEHCGGCTLENHYLY